VWRTDSSLPPRPPPRRPPPRAASSGPPRSRAPSRTRAGELASALGAEPADDLRAALASFDAAVALILDPGPFAEAAAEEDLAAIAGARARGVRVCTLEPMPGSAIELPAWISGSARVCEALSLGPPAALLPGFAAAGEVRAAFGPVRTMAVECAGTPPQGTLGAQLVRALTLVLSWMGEPELIDASYIAPHATKGLHPLPGRTLRGLRGHATAHLRLPDGRAAVLTASDAAPAWHIAATLVGPGGRLAIDADGFSWTGPDGALVDEHRRAGAAGAASTFEAAAAAWIASELASAAHAPTDPVPVFAAAHAALLSARTGVPESPATIARVVRGE
jgi:hypothetical protein